MCQQFEYGSRCAIDTLCPIRVTISERIVRKNMSHARVVKLKSDGKFMKIKIPNIARAPRNLSCRRIVTTAPPRDCIIRSAIHEHIMNPHFTENVERYSEIVTFEADDFFAITPILHSTICEENFRINKLYPNLVS